MSFTYDITSGNTRDDLRLLISDTKQETYVFEDEELDKFLSLEGGDVYMSAAMAFEVAAGDASKQAVMLQMPGVNLQATDVGKQLREQAALWKKRAGLAAQPGFAKVYGAGDTWIDSITGRGDHDFDIPPDSESAK